MAFERFTPIGRIGSFRVSIWNGGQIFFRKAVVDKLDLRNNPYVTLFFDRKLKKVGFQFTKSNREKDAIKITFNNAHGGHIGAHQFFKYFCIEGQLSKSYELVQDSEGYWTMDLKEGRKSIRMRKSSADK